MDYFETFLFVVVCPVLGSLLIYAAGQHKQKEKIKKIQKNWRIEKIRQDLRQAKMEAQTLGRHVRSKISGVD